MTSLPVLKTLDRRGRPLRDLRVSVTDRCNFRCTYCMPREKFGSGHPFLKPADILTFDEIATAVRVAVRLGVEKVRLTGGEPLLRADLPELVRRLAAIDGLDLALTTNGSLLRGLAKPLADAGLRRVTVSLDSLDPDVFRQMSDTDVPLSEVLDGIDAARGAGLAPLKVNAVIRRSVNDASVVELARRFKGEGVTVRFIEFMDVGTTNGWNRRDVVPAREIAERIDAVFPIEPLAPRYPGEVAERFRYRDGSGEIGIIASVTAPFCGSCTRARLSADGHLFTCLFASHGADIRPALRGDDPDRALSELFRGVWRARDDRYSEIRREAAGTPKIEMSYIGG